jgi:hypothetical protein
LRRTLVLKNAIGHSLLAKGEQLKAYHRSER